MADTPQKQEFPFEDATFAAELEVGIQEDGKEDMMQRLRNLVVLIEDYFRTHPNFSRSHADLALRYRRIMYRASWVALPLLSDDQVIELFHSGFSEAFYFEDLNIVGKVRAKLVGILLVTDRDQLKQRIRQVLLANSERFEQATGREIVGIPQTVGTWLRHYNAVMNGRSGSSLDRASYFSSAPVTKLSSTDVVRLKKLTELFDYLKLSSEKVESDAETLSLSIDGQSYYASGNSIELVQLTKPMEGIIAKMEEAGFFKEDKNAESLRPSGETDAASKQQEPPAGIVQQPTIPTTVKREITPASAGQSLPSKSKQEVADRSVLITTMNAPSVLQEVGVEQQVKMWRETQTTSSKLRDELLAGFHGSRRVAALAALGLLADRGELENLLVTDVRFVNLLAAYYRHIGYEAAAQELRSSPELPEHLISFLRLLLEERIRLTSSEAALVGVEVSSRVRQKDSKFSHLAYLDEKTGEYTWVAKN